MILCPSKIYLSLPFLAKKSWFNLCDRFGEGESSSSGELRIHSELRRPTSRDDLDPRGELQFVGDLNTFFD
jgi:hypothetical protein